MSGDPGLVLVVLAFAVVLIYLDYSIYVANKRIQDLEDHLGINYEDGEEE